MFSWYLTLIEYYKNLNNIWIGCWKEILPWFILEKDSLNNNIKLLNKDGLLRCPKGARERGRIISKSFSGIRGFSTKKKVGVSDMINNKSLTMDIISDEIKLLTENRFDDYSMFMKMLSPSLIPLDLLLDEYLEYKDNSDFITFLKYIPPLFRKNKEVIIKLYKLIEIYQSYNEKILGFFNDDVLKNILLELEQNRESIQNCFKELGLSREEQAEVMEHVVKKIDFDKLIGKDIENSDFFKLFWEKLSTYFKSKINYPDSDLIVVKNIVLNILTLHSLLIEIIYMIELKSDKRAAQEELFRGNLFEKIKTLIESKTKNYTKKYLESKNSRKKISYKAYQSNNDIILNLRELEIDLKSCIVEILKKNRTELSNIEEKLGLMQEQVVRIVREDHKTLISNFYKATGILDTISEISKDLSMNNVQSKSEKLRKYIEHIFNFYDNEELFYVIKLLDRKDSIDRFMETGKNLKWGNGSENTNISRWNNLNLDSYFYSRCRDILSLNVGNEEKQLFLENFILKYEKEFTLNLIRNLASDKTQFKLIHRIYKHSTPSFIQRMNTIVKNNIDKQRSNIKKNLKDLNKTGDYLGIALFLVMNGQDLSNILFSKVLKLVGGYSEGITQTQLIGELANEMFIVFKRNSTDSALAKLRLSKEKVELVKEIRSMEEVIGNDILFQFGHLIYSLFIEEFNYIFNVISITENNDKKLYVTIHKEYIQILASCMFNPIKLPMICTPKKWIKGYGALQETDGNQIGGYLLEEFNDLNKYRDIIRQNIFNKEKSEVSLNQVDTINYLNSVPFNINNNMLSFLLNDWKAKDSILFNMYNQLHEETANINNVSSVIKKEIIRHNTLYFTYSNILNIANLLKGFTIYFPTFLDFRGRIYPISSYLSYQGHDIARSLLFFQPRFPSLLNGPTDSVSRFKSEGREAGGEGQASVARQDKATVESIEVGKSGGKVLITELVNKISQNMVSSGGKASEHAKNILNSINYTKIEYVKLYLANVYGHSKWSRKKRINWFNKNIDSIVNTFKNDYDQFKIQFGKSAKEPAQFISCLIEYIKFLEDKSEIKTPILFDATCSGVQHLSALTTDHDLAKLVNLVSISGDDGPADFYEFCIKSIWESIDNLPEEDELLKIKLKNLNLTRKFFKTPIMTVPYNVTSIGIADKLQENFNKIWIDLDKAEELANKNLIAFSYLEKYFISSDTKANKGIYIFLPKENIMKVKNNNMELNNVSLNNVALNTGPIFIQKELNKLGNIIQSTVLNIIPPFSKLKDYFDKIIDISSFFNVAIHWVTPSGMKVSMSNVKMSRKQIKNNILKKAKPITILIPTDTIDYSSIKTGLMPNFIHSLDASNIHILIKKIKSILPNPSCKANRNEAYAEKEGINTNPINLFTIHDCFATDASSMQILELLVKMSFTEIYFTKNYLEFIHQSFIKQIGGLSEIYQDDNGLYILVPCSVISSRIKKNNKPATKVELPIEGLEEDMYKIYLPELPDYNWELNKGKIEREIMFNPYFIS
jgi:DNA-directed RNA polymerase